MFPKFHLLFSPEDSPAIGGKEMNADLILDELNKVDDEPETIDLTEKKPEKKIEKKEDKKEEIEDEDELEEDNDKEEKEDELKEFEEEEEPEELDELVTPVRAQEILKKYPNLFKDFPYLRNSYYRERQFTELFPTMDDAKHASESVEVLNAIDSDLKEGNSLKLLQGLKEESPNSFNKLVDNYLETLAQVDEKAHDHVVGNILKHAVMGMSREAKKTDNEKLKEAATLLYQFAFGNSDWEPPTQLAKEDVKNDESDKLKKEREEFFNQRFQTARNDLNTRVENSIRATIDLNIDPNNQMTSFIKRNAVNEVISKLGETLRRDKRVSTIMNNLWKNAAEKNFDKESLDRIRSAYVTAAKPVLQTLIKSVRAEAVKDLPKRAKEIKNDDSDESEETKEKTERTPRSKNTKSGENPSKGMSTLDFFNS